MLRTWTSSRGEEPPPGLCLAQVVSGTLRPYAGVQRTAIGACFYALCPSSSKASSQKGF